MAVMSHRDPEAIVLGISNFMYSRYWVMCLCGHLAGLSVSLGLLPPVKGRDSSTSPMPLGPALTNP